MIFKSKESYQNVLDAQKRGKITIQAKVAKRIEKYSLNPTICLYCNTPLEYNKKNNKFCSNSCSAAYNNKRRDKKEKHCLNCGKLLTTEQLRNKFCCSECFQEFQKNKNIVIKKRELKLGLLNDENARNWFRKLYEHKCSICGLTKWNNKEIPLVVDHIDGNHNNNNILNLRMICCNCDALLPTYKGRNKGNGRENRNIS